MILGFLLIVESRYILCDDIQKYDIGYKRYEASGTWFDPQDFHDHKCPSGYRSPSYVAPCLWCFHSSV